MINDMINICDNEYDKFFALPNVNGIGIGYKEICNVNTKELCLKVFVKKKLSLDLLKEDEIIPKFYKGFMTDVVETGEIVAMVDGSRYRPAPGGSQLNPSGAGFVGTFGCLVSTLSGTDLTTYILSNNHVLANSNSFPIGQIILQPGPPAATNTVASLSSFVPIDFSPGAQNLVDCAIAQVTSTTIVTNQIIDIGFIQGVASAQLGDLVQKRGRTTEYTTGTITSINTTVAVDYGVFGITTFIKQIATTNMSAGGDSGSIVLDSSNRVVALLFAGSTSNTFMNDIRTVLRSFRARLI